MGARPIVRRGLGLVWSAVLIGGLAVPAAPSAAQAVVRLHPLRLGPHRLHVEVADTPASRTRGLMYRRQLSRQSGMLFVFDHSEAVCMWMRNTPLALAAAFIDEQGHIVNIEEMHPHTDDLHCAQSPVRYVLEVQQGWFAQRKIRPGQRIAGLPF
jgi:uncharacterized membrane protein (UPF0127 family)